MHYDEGKQHAHYSSQAINMSKLTRIICSGALLATAGTSHGAVLATAYTPTEGKACVSVSRNRETGDTVKRCPGVAGYSLFILNSDDRVSVSIVTAAHATLPLNFWDVVTPAFSTLGPKVEWKLERSKGKTQPVALIVRVHTVDQTDVAAPKLLSFLVVAKIDGATACVTAKVPAWQANPNHTARAAASARNSACLPALH